MCEGGVVVARGEYRGRLCVYYCMCVIVVGGGRCVGVRGTGDGGKCGE